MVLLAIAIANKVNASFVPYSVQKFHFVVPMPHAFTCLMTLLIAVPIGKYAEMALVWFKRLFKIVEVEDPYYGMCRRLLGKPYTIVTLKNGKAYIGILMSATLDPNESLRLIEIQPIVSGYRNSDNLKVTYNTLYFDANSNEPPPEVTLLMPLNEIVTIGRYNAALHELMDQTGASGWDAGSMSGVNLLKSTVSALQSSSENCSEVDAH